MWLLLFIVAGIFSTAWLPALPSLYELLIILAAALALFFLLRAWRQKAFALYLAAILAGFFYGVIFGYFLLERQLPMALDRDEFQVTGEVVRLPAADSRRVGFYFYVANVVDPTQQWLIGKTVRLSWYSDAVVVPGERWNLQLRLRRPRGFVNPGGFDYQAWLLREGITATGYVRESRWNRKLSEAGFSFNNWRWQLREAITGLKLSETARGLLAALTVGDSSLLSSSIWAEFSRAGVIHLLVISGLHIGLAGLFGYWLGAAVARCVGLVVEGIVASYWSSVFCLLVAGGYAALSGFGLPALRALVMIGVVNVVLLLGRHIQRGAGLVLALLVVALLDPLAVHSAGFWLSFAAVAVLLWLLPGGQNGHKKFTQFVSAQWLLFVALSGLLMVWQLPQSMLSPVVNLVAIPWVSFLIVPLCLLAAVVYLAAPVAAEGSWLMAGWQLEVFASLIAGVSGWSLPSWSQSLWQLVGFLVATILLLLPRGMPARYLAILLLAGVTVSARYPDSEAPLTIAVLDVGQGLAIVVTTPRHTLVYDTGPAFSDRFNAGSGIVTPYLKQIGRAEIDTLVVSHGDSDHAGGLSGLLEHYQPGRIIAGEQLVPHKVHGVRPCGKGQAWEWDGVKFQVLWPERRDFSGKGHGKGSGKGYGKGHSNNRSCVLLISYHNQHILLPGDIERVAESRLLREGAFAGLPRLTLLVAPHHGSNTSSSRAFLQALKPGHVVFSAGYKHHFGHPHPKVMARYQMLGTQQWQTALSGALVFRWHEQGELAISETRHKSRRYWF